MAKSPKRIAVKPQLTRAEDALIVHLAMEGKSQGEIAQRLNCHQSSVSRVLSLYQDTRELAKWKLHSAAKALADRVIADADVDQALEVLDRLEVAPKRANTPQGLAVQVNIGVGPVPDVIHSAQLITVSD